MNRPDLLRPTMRLICGILLALFGVLWILQGLDLLGADGGMNGQSMWVVIGAITAAVGLTIAIFGVRSWPRR